MHLSSLSIKNFRAIADIEVEFEGLVNVVVGPNAIGKTTILEAIRLTKALVAPRTQGESTQTLTSLKALSPHNQSTLIPEALARDPRLPIDIRCRFVLQGHEINKLEEGTPQIATSILQSRMGQKFSNPASLVALLSSPTGKSELGKIETEVTKSIAALRQSGGKCTLQMRIELKSGRVISQSQMDAAFFEFLDQSLPPQKTIFSYFPADRAIPHNDPTVQLGAADVNHQVESHSSQPQLKYSRLKNTIFNTLVVGNDGRKQLDDAFQKIFKGILKGRKIESIGIDRHGLTSIRVLDTETSSSFSIDAMSSGEKGLILTFLLIDRSVQDGGLVLLDEPELHLNPAVCKNLLSFLLEEYSISRNIQIILCSHSPEILAGAFESDRCALYHLQSDRSITKVRRKDETVIADAMKKLGTSQSESLLYKATIFVEGDDDVELIEAGFGGLLRGFRLKELGGRQEVEKQIKLLQQAEVEGDSIGPSYFIFDRDEAPSSLTSSNLVRVLQWKRRCLENYLIDVDALSNLLMDDEIVRPALKDQGEVLSLLKKLALSQVEEFATREALASLKKKSPWGHLFVAPDKTIDGSALVLKNALEKSKEYFDSIKVADQVEAFHSDCISRRNSLTQIWDATWKEDCDGKRFFTDLHKALRFNIPLHRFKRRVILEMKHTSSENWRTVSSLLEELIRSPSQSS